MARTKNKKRIARGQGQAPQTQQADADCLVSLKDDLATSVSDFKIRIGALDYVDKTPIIEAFLAGSYPIHLVLRPRRCGKTTLLSMFRTFFERGSAEDVQKRKDLFFATPSLITTNPPIFESYFAQHPVIYIDMSDIRGATFEEMRHNYERVVRREFVRQQQLGHLDNICGYSKEVIQGVLDGTNMSGCHAFKSLAEVLYGTTKKKVILLIDEYDTPIVQSAEGGYRQEAHILFSQVYSSLLKNNTGFVQGTVMAGILRIQQTGFFSGLNNLVTFTLGSSVSNSALDVAYAKALLFTSNEVDALFHYYNEKEKFPFTLRKLKQWYGGYFAAGDIELFNPWSVCCALDRRALQGYWTASGVDNMLLTLIKNKPEFEDILDALLEGRGVKLGFINPKIGIDEDMDVNDILDVMMYAGYLIKEGQYLKIPNLELQANFFSWAAKTMSNERTEALINKDSRAMFDACISSPPVTFCTLFKKYIEKHGPAKFGHSEDKYLNYILCALQHGSCGRFTVRAETGGGLGRIDILIEEIGGTRAVILELKAAQVSSTRKKTVECLSGLAEKALRQIEDKKYRAGLDDGVVDLREYGIALYGKTCAVKSRILQRKVGGEWNVKRRV